MAAKKQVRKKKRERKHVERGQAHIQSTFNNTLITLTDMDGNALSWSSAGSNGFKGLQKVHTIRCTECCRSSCEGCYGARSEIRRSICKGTGFR